MDTSKAYIQMCRKAEEIQGLHINKEAGILPHIGDYFANSFGIVKICCKMSVKEVVTLCGVHDKWETDSDRMERVWLPRQDQLQEILDKDFISLCEDFWGWLGKDYLNQQAPLGYPEILKQLNRNIYIFASVGLDSSNIMELLRKKNIRKLNELMNQYINKYKLWELFKIIS